MKVNQLNELEESEKHIKNRVWFKYFPYWPLFLLLLMLAVAGAWLYIRYTVPMYESTATLQITDMKKGNEDSKIIESLNQLSTKKIIENETEVIRSRTLMTQVIKDLHLYAQVFQSGRVRSVSAYSTSPVKIQALSPDSLVEADHINLVYNKEKNQVTIHETAYPMNEWVTTPYGTLKFLPHHRSKEDMNNLNFSLILPKKLTLDLLKELDVSSTNKLSTIIDLTIRDEDPKRAEDILNGLLQAYTSASLRDKNNLASNTISFIDERLGIVSDEINGIERKMQQYKAAKGAIDISEQGKLFLENVSSNDKKLSDLNLQLTVLKQVEEYVKSKENSQGIVPSTVGVSDPLLSDLLDNLYEKELKMDNLKKTTGANSPVLVAVSDEITRLKPSILENINNQKKNLEASRQNLFSTNNTYNSMLHSIPQKERDLLEISRDQIIKSNTYNFLLQKREETALSLTTTVADSRIVDKAQSSILPVSPKKKLVYLLAVLLSIVLGFIIITFKELMKRTIMYRHEIEACTTSPIIGEIAYEKTKNAIVIGEGKRTFIAEQFRKLRTSLPYIGIKGERKKLLVTSTIPGDGKSFIVGNLSLSLAMTGKKVVMLEFDLSDPTLCDKIGMPPGKGLTEYLTGEAEPEEIIRRTTINENLFIISAGKKPQNPSEIIVKGPVSDLMKYLVPLFDYVIIDSAPVGLLSEAYVLSEFCDGTLYVIRHQHTPRYSIQRLDDNNEINELKNMGIVFNGIKQRGFGTNGYGYGYGYGYIHKDHKYYQNQNRKKDLV